MFRPDVCNPLRFPEVMEAAERARTELDRLNRIAHGPGASDARASILWAHVHGIACFLIDGPLGLAYPTEHQRHDLRPSDIRISAVRDCASATHLKVDDGCGVASLGLPGRAERGPPGCVELPDPA